MTTTITVMGLPVRLPRLRSLDRGDYQKYINSTDWRRKRHRRLKRDKFRCATCRHPGDLEVHHNTYVRLGRERLGDLVTLCDNCHRAIHDSLRVRRRSLWRRT